MMKDKEWREHATATLTALVHKPRTAAYIRALLLTTDKSDLAIAAFIKEKGYGRASATRIKEYRTELFGAVVSKVAAPHKARVVDQPVRPVAGKRLRKSSPVTASPAAPA